MNKWLNEEDRKWVFSIWERLQKKLEAECKRIGDSIPYIAEDGRYSDRMKENLFFWTNGFWPGILWQMYHDTGKDFYRDTAMRVETRLDEALAGYEGLHHDVGFMWQLSAVADYKLTGNAASRVRGLHAANLLAGRYNPRGKFIRAWNKDCTGWIIIDCMMNLPILYWASEQLNDPRYQYIAIDQADTCLKHIVREDGSCNHIVVLDPHNGDFIDNPAGQGYASGSSWTRGQAWGIYGFVLSYIYTKQEKYLLTAKKIANYFITNVQHSGYVPLVDFRMPAKPVKYDTTAGMIAACGLLELSKQLDNDEGMIYLDAAVSILKAIEKDYCDWDDEKDSIVQYGTVEYHRETEVHVPIIYGDYFLVEAIMKLRDSLFLIW